MRGGEERGEHAEEGEERGSCGVLTMLEGLGSAHVDRTWKSTMEASPTATRGAHRVSICVTQSSDHRTRMLCTRGRHPLSSCVAR